jgi:hypothetical protein
MVDPAFGSYRNFCIIPVSKAKNTKVYTKERKVPMMENKTHKGNYKGTANMAAENQDMAFVNDTLEETENTQNQKGAILKPKANQP